MFVQTDAYFLTGVIPLEQPFDQEDPVFFNLIHSAHESGPIECIFAHRAPTGCFAENNGAVPVQQPVSILVNCGMKEKQDLTPIE